MFKLIAQVRLLATQEAEAQESFRAATSVAVTEVVRVRNLRVADHRNALTSLAEKEVGVAARIPEALTVCCYWNDATF